MHAHYSFTDHSSHWQHIKNINKNLKDLKITSPFTLIIKAIQPINIRALMIAPEHKKRLGELNLIAKEQQNTLQRVLTPINIIPKKQILMIGGFSPRREYPQQVPELAVNVTCTKI